MKNILPLLLFSCILIAGCETILDDPPIVESVELNTDSAHTGHAGRYRVYLKSYKGDQPVFYSYSRYNSGETLVPASELKYMVEDRIGAYNDTIKKKNNQIEKLQREKEALELQLKEKAVLIRFLTGK